MGTELSVQRLRRLNEGGPRTGDAPEPDGATPEASDTTSDTAAESALSKWLPDTAPGDGRGWLATVRADPGRAGALALAGVGVLALLVTVFTLIRQQPPPVASANLPPVQMVSSGNPTPSGTAAGPVVVSVVGLVHKPGLVTLPSGARIADALDAAGGPLDGADLIGLNMARRVGDGEQVVVGIEAPPGQPTTMGSSVAGDASAAPPGAAGPAPTPSSGPPASSGPLDLNAATVEDLDTLPGIGPVTAAAIVAWRDAHGRFDSVDQLGDVDGIGPARLEKLRELVRA